MSRHDKELKLWSSKPPDEVRFEELVSFLRYYDLELQTPNSGSHWLLMHEKWEAFQKTGIVPSLHVINNTYSVPVHKKKVYKQYVKTIACFVQYLVDTQELQAHGDEDGKED